MSAAKSRFLNVLKLINEHGQGGSGFLRRRAGCFQQSLQIMFEIAVVCQSRLGFKIKSNFNVLIFDFERLGKACQPSKRTLRQVLRVLIP